MVNERECKSDKGVFGRCEKLERIELKPTETIYRNNYLLHFYRMIEEKVCVGRSKHFNSKLTAREVIRNDKSTGVNNFSLEYSIELQKIV